MTIFVTVGAQMPFDRLVRVVDRWAEAEGRHDVFAQVGDTRAPPTYIPFVRHLPPQDFRRRAEDARVLIAHAGMGSIMTALELGKPILVMPRRGALRETRNDHQVSTARRFLERAMIEVAFDEEDLERRLARVDLLTAASPVTTHRLEQLLDTVRSFIGKDRRE